MTVTKHTRAGQNGKKIICTHCGTMNTVYHFSWAAITCGGCDRMVNKENFLDPANMSNLAESWYNYTCLHDGEIVSFDTWLNR